MRSATVIIAVVLVGAPNVVRADGCANPQTQLQMNDCASADFRVSDGRLNSVYGQVMERLGTLEEAKRRLVTSEKAWIQFRDAECTFVATETDGGSVHAMLVTMCKTNLTKDRIRQLNAYLHCEEGDLSCPVPPT